MEDNVYTLKKTARFAGLLYLIWVIIGVYGLIFVPLQTIVSGNAAATAKKILSNEFIFRTGIIVDIVTNTIWVFLVLILYRLFKDVNKRQAKLMVALVIVQIPAVFFVESLNITSLMLFKGEILQTFQLSQRQDLAMLFLKMNDYGTLILEMFWGLWLLPFGYLVYKSGFIPRLFGILLLLNGIAYIIASFVSILFPDYQTIITQIAMPFWGFGEISITLWLLIKGIKNDIPTVDIKYKELMT